MNLKTGIVFSLLALTYAPSSFATTIICDGCTAQAMIEAAKNQASTLKFGTHDIGVLNITGADYNLYKAVVGKDNNSDEPVVRISKSSSPAELKIESSAVELQNSINDLKQFISEKIVLPADSPYKTATIALSELSEFSTYATHIVRKRTNPLKDKVKIIESHSQNLVENAQVEVSAVALSVSTKITTVVRTWVVLPDLSKIEVDITFQNNLADGLVMTITAHKLAVDKDGKMIPISKTN